MEEYSILNNIKEVIIHGINYIYPYFVVYFLFFFDNIIIYYIIGIPLLFLSYYYSSKLNKEKINYSKLFFLILILPISLPIYIISILNILFKKVLLFPLLRLEYPYIPLHIRQEIYELNELKKIKARKRREIKIEGKSNKVNIY